MEKKIKIRTDLYVGLELVYEEGSSYHRGINPYNEVRKTVVRIEERLFEFYRSSNHTNFLYRVDPINEIGVLPSSYEEDDGNTSSWCRHGGTKYVEVLRYSNVSGDPIISDLQKEVRLFCMERFIQSNQTYSKEYIEGLSLTPQEKKVAHAWRQACVNESLGSKWGLDSYSDIFENIENIASGKAIVLCHLNGHYSQPGDWIVNNNQIGCLYSNIFDWGQLCHNSYTRGTSFTVLKPVKEVPVESGKLYVGSVYRQGYPVDVYREGNYFSAESCFTGSGQDWYKQLDLGLKCPRFELETGLEGQFVEDNENVLNDKITKRNYFLDVMKSAQLAFNVNWAGARDLLAQAGTVTILALAVDTHYCHMSEKQLAVLLEKGSNAAVDRFFNKIGLGNRRPVGRFPDIMKAAEIVLQQLSLKKVRKFK